MELSPQIGLGMVFAVGYDAHCLGLPRSTAPGEPGTDGYLAWLAGWDEARAMWECSRRSVYPLETLLAVG